MNRPKIVIDSDIPFIHGRLEPFADCLYTDQWGFSPENVADAKALVIRTRTRCNAELLAGSDVEIISTATIGMDQFDLPWCAANGIKALNAPGCNAPGVAQYVWSCLIRSGFRPEGHTVGIVGCGNVGSIVAHWGELLGARVLVSDPPKARRGELQYPDTPLDRLLEEADAVTLHTPMIPDGDNPTYHLIGEEQLRHMRPGSYFVNAARGPVADNAALAEAIPEKGITAIIDVWEGEPNLNPKLLDVARIATFHIAGYSLEGKQRATRMALENIARHFGWDVDMSGLAPAYVPHTSLDPQAIVDSFDPTPIDSLLRANPADFDALRAAYVFRPEVLHS